MLEILDYLVSRPRLSWRLGIVCAILSAPPLFVGALLLTIPLQESRLLGQPLFSFRDWWMWAAAALHLVVGLGALALAWGNWRERAWAAAISLPRGFWLVLLGTVTFKWAQQLLA